MQTSALPLHVSLAALCGSEVTATAARTPFAMTSLRALSSMGQPQGWIQTLHALKFYIWSEITRLVVGENLLYSRTRIYRIFGYVELVNYPLENP